MVGDGIKNIANISDQEMCSKVSFTIKLDSADGPAVEMVAIHHEEWTQQQIIRMDGEYYWRRDNHGKRGGYQPEQFKPDAKVIGLRECRRMLFNWGYDPEEVASMTK